MTLRTTRKGFPIFLCGMLLVFIPSCIVNGYLRDTQIELIKKCVTIPPIQVPAFTLPPLILPKIIAVEDVVSMARDPLERERQIRNRVERLISWEGIDDVQTVEPFFENGHLSRIRLHRDGQKSNLRYMIILPSDEADTGRSLIQKIIESSSQCSTSRAPFFDHGKLSKVFYLVYSCESLTIT